MISTRKFNKGTFCGKFYFQKKKTKFISYRSLKCHHFFSIFNWVLLEKGINVKEYYLNRVEDIGFLRAMYQNLIKKQHGFSIHGKHRNFQEDNGKIEWRSHPSYMNLWSCITGLLGVFFLTHLTLSFFFSVSPMEFWNFSTNFDIYFKNSNCFYSTPWNFQLIS